MAEDIRDFSKDVHRNSIWNVVLRGLGILLGLVLTRYNIVYLGASLYGLWVTIASISAWANIGDLGISNGLRNELTKAIASGNVVLQRNLLKTAISLLSKVSFVLFLVLSVVSEGLFILDIMDSALRIPMYITNAFFCFNFVLGISRTISYSYQISWYASLAQTVTILINILGVLALMLLGIAPDLILFAFVVGVCSVLGNLAIVLRLGKVLRNRCEGVILGVYDSNQRKVIMNVGLHFFVLQVCCIILYATDNVIINKLFQSELVTKYSVINAIYNTGESLFSLLLISLWSAVTYAAEKKEFTWIKKEVNNLRRLWLLFSLGVVVVSFMLNMIVRIWLGKSAMYYEPGLIVLFAVYTITTQFGAIYVNVTNGLGRIKLQMFTAIIGAVLNIPLSIFFAKYMGMGISGIKLATLICCLGSIVIIPIDITLFLNKKSIAAEK